MTSKTFNLQRDTLSLNKQANNNQTKQTSKNTLQLKCWLFPGLKQEPHSQLFCASSLQILTFITLNNCPCQFPWIHLLYLCTFHWLSSSGTLTNKLPKAIETESKHHWWLTANVLRAITGEDLRVALELAARMGEGRCVWGRGSPWGSLPFAVSRWYQECWWLHDTWAPGMTDQQPQNSLFCTTFARYCLLWIPVQRHLTLGHWYFGLGNFAFGHILYFKVLWANILVNPIV